MENTNHLAAESSELITPSKLPTQSILSHIYDKSLILAYVSVVGYIMSYSYELGVSTIWNIPLYLIRPDFPRLITTVGLVIVIVTCFKLLIDGVYNVLHGKNRFKSLLSLTMISNGAMLLSFFSLWVIYGELMTIIYFVIGTFIIINAPIAFMWLFARNKFESITQYAFNTGLESQLDRRTEIRTLVIIFALFTVIVISFLSGQGYAMKETNFIVITGNSELVVLRKYDDILVCNSFNQKYGLLTDSFSLIPISETKDIFFKRAVIGPFGYVP